MRARIFLTTMLLIATAVGCSNGTGPEPQITMYTLAGTWDWGGTQAGGSIPTAGSLVIDEGGRFELVGGLDRQTVETTAPAVGALQLHGDTLTMDWGKSGAAMWDSVGVDLHTEARFVLLTHLQDFGSSPPDKEGRCTKVQTRTLQLVSLYPVSILGSGDSATEATLVWTLTRGESQWGYADC
jgi:hypothetical protein